MGEPQAANIFEEKAAREPLDLRPHQEVVIDTNNTIIDENGVNALFGVEGRAVVGVDASSDKSFLVVDVRKERTKATDPAFLLIDDTFDGSQYYAESGKGYVEIIEDDPPITIGRIHHTESFDYPATVSRNHFSLQYVDGILVLDNLKPTNKTTLVYEWAAAEGLNYQRDGRTVEVIDRVSKEHGYGEPDETAPYGYHLNHAIIGRASKSVKDGVYLGGSRREAILVDDKSRVLNQVYKDLYSELNRGVTLMTRTVLTTVMRKVQEVMPYSGDKTKKISQPYSNDQLIGLSEYVDKRAGVCRHQALLAALLLENLISDGFLKGRTWVERNTIVDEDGGGTHAWAMYESPDGIKFVVDAAQHFVGTKEQAREKGKWDYYLSTD